jgi:hypothetical protein
MGIVDRIYKIDRRVIIWIIVILVAIPMITPIGLPIPPTEFALGYYNTIESVSDEPGAIFLIHSGLSSTAFDELKGGMFATIKHIASKEGKILWCAAYSPECVSIIESYFAPLCEELGMVYGEDYIIFDFLAGGAATFNHMARDLKEALITDKYGTSLYDVATLPIMAGLDDYEDIDCVVNYAMGFDTSYDIVSIFHVPCVYGNEGWQATAIMSHYVMGLIQGFLSTIRGCAEYEFISGFPGPSVASVESITVANMYLVALIVVTNILFFYKKYTGESK